MGIFIIGSAIAAAITSDKIQELKRKINELINRHESITKDVQKLSKDLKKLDLAIVSQKLKQMNENLAKNLQTVIADQQTKLQMIKGIDPGRVGVDPKTILQKLIDVLNVVAAILTVIQIMCATTPATIAITGFLLVVNFIFSIFVFIGNLKTLQQLQAKHAQLQEFFKKGGQFERQVNKMAEFSFDMIENFYIFVIHFKSMVNELAITVNLLALSKKQEDMDYQSFIDILKMNPFNEEFENECYQMYRKFINIKSNPLESRVNMSAKYLDQFDRKHNLVEKIEIAGQIASKFRKNSPISNQLDKATTQVKKITSIKKLFQGDFKARLEKSGENLVQHDKDILKDLMYEVRYENDKQLIVLVVVSFFTTSFFGDDKTGKTLFKENLEEMNKKTGTLAFIGVSSKGYNTTQLPEPQDKALLAQWSHNKQYLETQYRMQSANNFFEFLGMYMRMDYETFYVYSGNKTRLTFYYGIYVRPLNSLKEEAFQLPGSRLFQREYMPPGLHVSKIEKMEEENENLGSLCSFVWFFINGIAYPERVTKFSIIKVGAKYRAVVEWKDETVDPQIFGKFLEYNVGDIPVGEEIPEEPTAKIFFKTTFPETNQKVLFKFK